MQAPPPSRHNPVPATPPAVIEEAPQDVTSRFTQPENYKFDVAQYGYEIEEEVAPEVRKMLQERQDLSRELEEATGRLSDEQSQPVIDRRKERSHDKRGR